LRFALLEYFFHKGRSTLGPESHFYDAFDHDSGQVKRKHTGFTGLAAYNSGAGSPDWSRRQVFKKYF